MVGAGTGDQGVEQSLLNFLHELCCLFVPGLYDDYYSVDFVVGLVVSNVVSY